MQRQSVIRSLIRELDAERKGSRGDVARELSLAITHLEDADIRITRAAIRAKYRPADAEGRIDSELAADEGFVGDDVELDTTEQEA